MLRIFGVSALLHPHDEDNIKLQIGVRAILRDAKIMGLGNRLLA
jgi:hypothetical protein